MREVTKFGNTAVQLAFDETRPTRQYVCMLMVTSLNILGERLGDPHSTQEAARGKWSAVGSVMRFAWSS